MKNTAVLIRGLFGETTCLYLEEHGAVLLSVRWLNVIWSTSMSASSGSQNDVFYRFFLKVPSEAAAPSAELLRLIEPGVLQDAFWESTAQAALTGTTGQHFTCTEQDKNDCTIHITYNNKAKYLMLCIRGE